jgi:O-antigen ligase
MLNSVVFLFGALLVLAQMTSLRGASPIGVLDIAMVVTAILTVAGSLIFAEKHRVSPGAKFKGLDSGVYPAFRNSIFQYAIFSAIIVAISLSVNIQRPAASTESLTTAAVPFFATALVIVGFVLALYHRTASALMSGFIVASLLLGLVYVFGALTQNSEMMYESRFKGLALNPNQTALQSLATLLILIVFTLKQDNKLMLLAALAAIPLTMTYGIATRSDSLMLCLPGVFAAAGTIVLDRFRIKLWVVIALGAVMLAAFLLALAIALPGIFGSAGGALQAQFSQGSQDTDRQLLWQHGLIAWSDSPWIGHGPGAWSGIGGPYQGLEAHNSIIDWMTISGTAGLIPIFLMVSATFRFRRRFALFRVIGILTLLLFTLFHFTFRLPVFWVAVAVLFTPFFSWADDPVGGQVQPGARKAQ